MLLERKAQELIKNVQKQENGLYKQKCLKYKEQLRDRDAQIKKYQIENEQQKDLIAALLIDIESYKNKQQSLELELIEQQQLTESAVYQLKQHMNYSNEDKLLQEQRQFELKLAAQSTQALDRVKQHFEEEITKLKTPKGAKTVKSPVLKKKK
ncbi:hypothetical protein pb186bvf_021073 [Paramecium bursaria]